MGIIGEKYDEIKESVSKAWNGIFEGNGNFLEFKPPPGTCSPDEVSARMDPNAEFPRLERQRIAQECNSERMAEVKKADAERKRQAELDAKRMSNTEGRIAYCEGLRRADRIYCDNVSRNYDIKQLELIAYILKNYDPSDLRDETIKAVENIKSPSILFSISLQLKVGDFGKDLKSDSRVGKPADKADNDYAVPGASVDKSVGMQAGKVRIGVRVTGGVVVPIRKNENLENIKKAKKTIMDTPRDFEEQAKQKAKEEAEKQAKKLREIIESIQNK
jgi:hypothetical protein